MTGERLKTVRNELKLNQKDFGKLFNLTGAAISEIEREKAKPTFSVINKLESIGININWFLTGDGEMFKDKISQLKAGQIQGVDPEILDAIVRDPKLQSIIEELSRDEVIKTILFSLIKHQEKTPEELERNLKIFIAAFGG